METDAWSPGRQRFDSLSLVYVNRCCDTVLQCHMNLLDRHSGHMNH